MNFKKITIAAGIFPPDIGGPATYVVRLADALTERGWKVRVVCYADMKHVTCNMKQYKFPVFRVLRRGNVFLRYFRYFWKLVNVAKDSDLIYAQGPISAGLPAMLGAKMMRKKFVVKVVGDPAWEQAIGKGMTSDMIDEFQTKSYGGKVKRLKNMRRFVCQQADLVITPSEYLKKIVQGWGVDEDKIKVIYNAIEDNNQDTRDNNQTITDNQIPNFQNFRESYNNLESDNYDIILSVGRLVKWKGMDKLIEIMPELLRENPRFELVILGDGPEKENYQLSPPTGDHQRGEIINYQLQNKVELTGKVSHERVLEYFKKAKMFILNTGYEGLPHTVLEAMQAGCPVITTNVGGNPEVVRDGENGLLVEYNDKEQLKSAILRMWREEDLRVRLTEQAKRDLGRFSFSEMIEGTEAVLMKVTHSNSW